MTAYVYTRGKEGVKDCNRLNSDSVFMSKRVHQQTGGVTTWSVFAAAGLVTGSETDCVDPVPFDLLSPR